MGNNTDRYHTLEFLNPRWHYGENVTVRLGAQWADKVSVGDYVQIAQTGDVTPIATGKVIDTRLCDFPSITIAELKKEHDPSCRTPDGLVYAMLQAYPDFHLNSTVTVLTFKIL